MKKQITQRQKDELARRKAMGLAWIERPLKFILKRTYNNPYSGPYEAAKAFAKSGDGGEVQRIAMQLA